MLQGLTSESAAWIEHFDLRVEHDIVHQEYSQLYSRAAALRDNPPEYDLLMARATEVKRRRDAVLRQLVDMPDYAFATGTYSAQTILPAGRPSAVRRAFAWLR